MVGLVTQCLYKATGKAKLPKQELIYLFIYSLFIVDSQLMKQPSTIKNSYVYIHAKWRQLPNVEKMKNCKLNINQKTCVKS